MRVRTALQIINTELDTYFAEQEGDFDEDTRFCVSWFEQHGMKEARFRGSRSPCPCQKYQCGGYSRIRHITSPCWKSPFALS